MPLGWALQVCDEAVRDLLYLADYRSGYGNVTIDKEDAEYFPRFIDAEEMGRRLSHITGTRHEPITIPPADSPLSPPPKVGHVHTSQCYDDPGPGHGSPFLVCNNGEWNWPQDERVRLSDGRTLDVTVDELAASQALEDAAAEFHLPLDAPTFVLGEVD